MVVTPDGRGPVEGIARSECQYQDTVQLNCCR
jgi:hypothetical protein